MTQQLEHLAAAYFHQDFDLDSGSPTQVVDAFLKGEGEGEASAAELVSRSIACSPPASPSKSCAISGWTSGAPSTTPTTTANRCVGGSPRSGFARQAERRKRPLMPLA